MINLLIRPCLHLLLSLIFLSSLSSCKTGEKKPNFWPRFMGSGLTGSAPAQHMMEARRDALIKQLSPGSQQSNIQDNSFASLYERAQTDAAARNRLVWDLIQIADVNYQLYEQGLVAKIQGGNALTNIGVAGMNAASTLSGSNTLKTTISTLTTFVTGAQAEINKTLFRDMAIQSMVANMRAARAKEYLVILKKLRKYGKDINKYPVGEALTDVLKYYQAGTFTSAVQEIQKTASKIEEDASNITDAPADTAAAKEEPKF